MVFTLFFAEESVLPFDYQLPEGYGQVLEQHDNPSDLTTHLRTILVTLKNPNGLDQVRIPAVVASNFLKKLPARVHLQKECKVFPEDLATLSEILQNNLRNTW